MVSVKANGKPSKREIELTLARVAGYHADTGKLTRLIVERKAASYIAIREAYRVGARQKESGIPCSCCTTAAAAELAATKD